LNDKKHPQHSNKKQAAPVSWSRSGKNCGLLSAVFFAEELRQLYMRVSGTEKPIVCEHLFNAQVRQGYGAP
jgi:hypothetical protein